jgi:hypothetical protein
LDGGLKIVLSSNPENLLDVTDLTPAVSPFASHWICPLRIIFIAS